MWRLRKERNKINILTVPLSPGAILLKHLLIEHIYCYNTFLITPFINKLTNEAIKKEKDLSFCFVVDEMREWSWCCLLPPLNSQVNSYCGMIGYVFPAQTTSSFPLFHQPFINSFNNQQSFTFISVFLAGVLFLFSLGWAPREKKRQAKAWEANAVWVQRSNHQPTFISWEWKESEGWLVVEQGRGAAGSPNWEWKEEKQTNHQLIAGFPRPAAINGCWVVCSLAAQHWAAWCPARFFRCGPLFAPFHQ